jgi:hypothetical protein
VKPNNLPQALQIAAGCTEAVRHPAPGARRLGLLLQAAARRCQGQTANSAVARGIRMC